VPALSPGGYAKKDRAAAPLADGGVEDGEALSWDSAAGRASSAGRASLSSAREASCSSSAGKRGQPGELERRGGGRRPA
jgi:hypothetical protein